MNARSRDPRWEGNEISFKEKVSYTNLINVYKSE
jgi:hypothetical protein